MSVYLSGFSSRLTRADRRLLQVAMIVALHLAAVAIMIWSEIGPVRMAVFLLVWGLLNFFWLLLLRRPGLSAALSLAMIVALIVISRFKFKILWLTASFIDVMIIDSDTFSFLWSIFPSVRWAALATLVVAIPLAVAIWRLDPFRVRRRIALTGGIACLATLTAISFTAPLSPGEAFGDENYVSGFARSGVEAVAELMTHGILESDAQADGDLKTGMDEPCVPTGKPPHIILVHDEGSFDVRDVPGIKAPEDYGNHFLSFDGKERKFLVEGAGGPSWYTEYNVITGLSSRSYGRFQFFVTRIAAGHVMRGLPRSLQRCGYRTFTMYPVNGGFLAARLFYQTTGVQHFIDGKDINGGTFEPDHFYFDRAIQMIDRERKQGPMFLFVYLTANHFPWDHPFHEELTPPEWQNPGNKPPEVDEYLRRQAMSEHDYADFLARLKTEFPEESFLLVRYGDHQPDFGKLIMDRTIDVEELARRLMAYDPRYFTTYYAIDAVNFAPVNVSSALPKLDAPYLPLIVQEAAGLPLDPSFAEQEKILQRCNGMFYACASGAEARRFNRLLIDAGLIKRL